MKLSWNASGYLEKIDRGNQNVIYPWGIECADTQSFFSLETGGWLNRQANRKLTKTKTKLHGEMDVSFATGSFHLTFTDSLKANTIKRHATLTPHSSLWLLDFVIRYRFHKQCFHTAKIAGKTVKHQNNNVYHQYPTTNVQLLGDKMIAEVSLTSVSAPADMKPYLYVRDRNDEWIVHCRLLPSNQDKTIIKLNVPWYNQAIPGWLSDSLLKSKRIKEYLLYRGERARWGKSNLLGRLFKPSAYPLIKVEAGSKMSITSKITFN